MSSYHEIHGRRSAARMFETEVQFTSAQARQLMDLQIREIQMEVELLQEMLALDKEYIQMRATKDNWAGDILPVVTQAIQETNEVERILNELAWPYNGLSISLANQAHNQENEARQNPQG